MFKIPSHFRVCRSARSNNQRTAQRRRTFQALWLLASLLILTNVGDAQDEAKPPKQKPPQVAPPNHALLSSTIDGWYFVPKEFKENYDATLARLEALQSDVASGKIRASKAQAELTELQNVLAMLRKEIEAKKVHVVGTTLYEQTETIEFELGQERRLAITCNQVHVIGWEAPQVKCVLKKMVLAPDEKPVDEHLKAIKIVHKRARAEFAGQTQAEIDQYEREYLANDGAKLTESQREGRRELLAQFARERAIYRDYVAKEIDQITVDGLDYQSNKSIERAVMSEGGTGQYGSSRQRYGEITVYVPSCAGVIVRGAERGLIVEKLAAPLIIVPDDSTDSNHRGVFEVRNLRGDLVSRNFPLKSVTDVDGRVTINSKLQFDAGGSSTSHYDDLRDLQSSRPLPVQMHRVTGGVDLQYGNANLDLREIQGKVSVWNEFGNTHLVASAKFAPAAHRIISQAGRIEVELSEEAWSSTPVLAATNYGRIRTNIPREQFDDFRLQGADKRDGSRRDWPGFRTVVKNKDPQQHILSTFGQLDRFQQAMDDTSRSAGLDLISRGGNITVIRK